MRIAFFGILVLFSTFIVAQDITSFGKKSNYKLIGHLNIGSNFYNYSGNESSRYAPFGYMVNGGVNAQIGAINIPVSFSFNHLNGSISSPFNLYGASPYYKWIKLHLGHRTLNFSPYVYAGRAFYGVGVELTPGKFSLVSFKGKIRNLFAIRDTFVAGAIALPTYDRNITGVKLAYGSRQNSFELMGIKVKDEDLELNEEINFNPLENFVLGAKIKLRIFKKLRVEANLATSLFTSNQRAGEPAELALIEENFEFLHDPNNTTRASFAGDAAIKYAYKGYELGVKYKRIDPFYYSLGTNFMQNDIENYTVNFGLPLLSRRLRLRGSFGIQKDNLKNQKSFTSNRKIGAITISYLPSANQNFMFRYANYQHENQSGLQFVNDTLRILTTTHNFNFNSQVKVFETDRHNGTFQATVFNNRLVDEATLNNTNSNFNGFGSILKFLYNYKEWKLSGGPTFNYNNYEYSTFTQGRIGGGFFITKSMFDNTWNTSLSVLVNQNQLDGKSNGQLRSINLSSRYSVNKSHQLNMRLTYIQNNAIVGASYNELRGNISYGWRWQ